MQLCLSNIISNHRLSLHCGPSLNGKRLNGAIRKRNSRILKADVQACFPPIGFGKYCMAALTEEQSFPALTSTGNFWYEAPI